MEKMENMENPKKLAVATIAGLTEVAGMAAPAMADETADFITRIDNRSKESI